MGKVDWTLAELTYITNDSVSYTDIAEHFGVAKSTIVRHAVKTGWPEKRREYAERRIAKLEEKTMEKRVDVEERQLERLRLAQSAFHIELVRIGKKQLAGEEVTHKEVVAVTSLTGALTKAIMMERAILGLSTKPLRIKDDDAIHEYKRLMGYEEESSKKHVKELKSTLESLDRMIERRQIIQAMIDDYNK